ncbi:hypothetical protein N183_02865 [Sinorhizobium sp. Sb3]|nr:hypothetical protein N183_02865 [Sinorhizobium sp. Sb3]
MSRFGTLPPGFLNRPRAGRSGWRNNVPRGSPIV